MNSSVRSRIRNGALLLLALNLAMAVYALPGIWRLGGAIRQILHDNYISIQAGQHMHRSLHRLQVAELRGDARPALVGSRDEFMHWMDVENHSITEVGEPELARELTDRGNRLFAEITAAPPGSHHDAEFDRLQALADDLIAMNQAAMFRDENHAKHLSWLLTYGSGIGFTMVVVLGIVFSWMLGWSIVRPLDELVERLRGVGARRAHVRLSPQKLAELDAVAQEFNQMAQRLEHYDLLNVEKLIREQSKIEAIVESLEDGVVLIDAEGVVAHINECAALIMGIDAGRALGSRFDDLGENNPRYIRVRDALRTLADADSRPRAELQMHVRGRDHYYVLKPMPLRKKDRALGMLLVLQDVTYLRDQDRARTNLLATLSHEIRTPVTSLGLCAELLGREESLLTPEHRELVQAVVEECRRITQLSDNLLNLARGQIPAIAMQRTRLNLAKIVEDVTNRFRIQAQEKNVRLETHIEEGSVIHGDPVKLSWVVSNLVGNALRYTPEGKSIEVTARSTGDLARLEVADSGPGIPPEIRDRIFERFTQYDTHGHSPGSAGLGLAIAKDIVEAHGGRIFVESNNHHGSRFVVQLPTMGEPLITDARIMSPPSNGRA